MIQTPCCTSNTFSSLCIMLTHSLDVTSYTYMLLNLWFFHSPPHYDHSTASCACQSLEPVHVGGSCMQMDWLWVFPRPSTQHAHHSHYKHDCKNESNYVGSVWVCTHDYLTLSKAKAPVQHHKFTLVVHRTQYWT